jgi:protocatechuate 3,4-dioxygenase, beta subunit
MKRRELLGVAGTVGGWAATVARTGWAQGGLPTPSQVTGPYYPVEPIPLRDRLLLPGGAGEALRLVGRVLNTRGEALVDTRLEFWQADAKGRYRHPDDAGFMQVDSAFAGFGAVVTDAKGAYALDTIVPVPYGGRPPHIHVRLHRHGHVQLTTQLYLRGLTKEGGAMGLMAAWQGDRTRLSLDLTGVAGAGRSATFDFVLPVPS